MHKLNEYIEMAATEFFQETGKAELATALDRGMFQDRGVQDDYPAQDLGGLPCLGAEGADVESGKG